MKQRRTPLAWIVIAFSALLASLIFLFPLVASALYSFKGEYGKGHSLANYRWLLHQQDFGTNLLVSLKLTILAGALNLLLMVPTMVYLHLKGEKFKSIVDFFSILPLIIPVVSLAIGAQVSMPSIIQNTEYELVFFYVIISLPYSYRALDTALSAVNLKTLVEASRSLGASRAKTILRVIVPSIKSGIVASLFLTFALSIGEYTITSLLHWVTFSTWTVDAEQQNTLGGIAISNFSFIGTVALLGTFAILSRKTRTRVEVEE